MKRFLLFVGPVFYPQGGWEDFDSGHDDLKQVNDHLEAMEFDTQQWFQVVDTEAMKVCQNGEIVEGKVTYQ